MSAHKHTPQDWLRDETTVYALNLEGSNRFSARVEGGWTTRGRTRTQVDELVANARLISAAPDSLDANVMFVESMDRFCGIEPDWDDVRIYDELPSSELARAYFAARAAIAKATGEPA
ncbi:hypothetical protein [Stenotrophomonas acidaminiphila]|uniref:hypothetical protein n=1 Tax=Stenotrophomonas acidaminiphila TaxID=128780 RepID=UPI0028A755DD|nr:hypothetical protein [Stenotrophomonas acidaminiphila]